MKMFRRNVLSMFASLALLLTACVAPLPTLATLAPTRIPATNPASTQPLTEPTATTTAVEPTAEPTTSTEEKITLTIWDYYGEASPLKPLIEPFQQQNPNIVIQHESLDRITTLEKINAVLAGGSPPDVVTVDMTWLPRLAAFNAFTNLKDFSGGQLNGVPFDQAYLPNELEAITFNDQIIAALYDFDVYALYYRADLFDAKGLPPPTSWDELVLVAHQIAAGDKNLYEFDADTSHGSQWIYENEGSLLNADNTGAAFNSPEAIEAIQFYSDLLLQERIAIYWTPDLGDRLQGIRDGHIAMFSDGPDHLSVLKNGAPEMAGLWKVAQHPKNKQTGSYLGGTGLVIPQGSTHKEAAWKFIEFAMRLENQIGVYTHAGSAPALLAALQSEQVNVADPYFGGQQALAVFVEAMKTAHHFPYVRQWNDVDAAFTTALQEIALGHKPVQQALDEAATVANEALGE
jgi:ABC-type glycerol-3-phosphate transport system substrate-binding protein